MACAGKPYGRWYVREGVKIWNGLVTFRHLGKLCPQAVEIDKRCKKGGDLYTRCLNEAGNKLLERDETRSGWGLVEVDLMWSMGRSRRRGTRRRRWRRVLCDGNDTTYLTGEVEDHVPCNRLLNEADELRVVEGCWNKGKRVSPRHRERERVELIE
jgi:hypothetical protein